MEKDPNLEIQLPPGFRFHPSDEELIVHYLRNKATSCPLPASFIADIDLYKFNPWELPSKALFGDDEWFFFTPRDRKYPNGLRPNRAAGSGYWKATGTDKPILSYCGMKSIGVKKALVFYKGRPPKGSKTDWIMHEYRLLDSVKLSYKQRGSMRLDDWVLCRVRQKISSPRSTREESNEPSYSEPASYWQQINNYETAKIHVFNEFPMLPYILGSKTNGTPPSMANASSNLSYQQRNDNNAFAHGDTSNMEAAQLSESTAEERLKRKLYEQSQMDLLYDSPPFKKLREGDHEREMLDIDLSKSYTSSFNSFDHWNSIIQPQELNNLAFSSGYI